MQNWTEVMPNWTRPAAKAEDVAILLFQRFSNHRLANTFEPLPAVNVPLIRGFYLWRFVTLDGAAAESSGGLPVIPNSI